MKNILSQIVRSQTFRSAMSTIAQKFTQKITEISFEEMYDKFIDRLAFEILKNLSTEERKKIGVINDNEFLSTSLPDQEPK